MGDDRLALITTDPAVLNGQAVIAGARVPVSVVLDCLAAGGAGWNALLRERRPALRR